MYFSLICIKTKQAHALESYIFRQRKTEIFCLVLFFYPLLKNLVAIFFSGIFLIMLFLNNSVIILLFLSFEDSIIFNIFTYLWVLNCGR